MLLFTAKFPATDLFGEYGFCALGNSTVNFEFFKGGIPFYRTINTRLSNLDGC
jgi:hypothetical protein